MIAAFTLQHEVAESGVAWRPSNHSPMCVPNGIRSLLACSFNELFIVECLHTAEWYGTCRCWSNNGDLFMTSTALLDVILSAECSFCRSSTLIAFLDKTCICSTLCMWLLKSFYRWADHISICSVKGTSYAAAISFLANFTWLTFQYIVAVKLLLYLLPSYPVKMKYLAIADIDAFSKGFFGIKLITHFSRFVLVFDHFRSHPCFGILKRSN